jgi:hypothetical protein
VNWLKNILAAGWIAITSLTLAQLNVLLGTVSLLIGIGYQLWKWRKEYRHRSRAPFGGE